MRSLHGLRIHAMSGSSDRSQRRMCASMPVLSDSRPLGDDRPSPRLPGRGCARSAVLQGVGLRHGRRPRAPLQPYYYTLDPASPSPWSVLGKLGPHRLVCTVGTAAWRSVLGLEKGIANAQCRHQCIGVGAGAASCSRSSASAALGSIINFSQRIVWRGIGRAAPEG